MMKRTAKELAEAIGARLEGDGAMEIAGVAAPERAGARDLIYVEAAKHAERVAASAAMCVVAGEGLSLPGKTVLRSAQPKVAFAKAAARLLERATIDRGSLNDTRIAEGVKLDNLVHVGHNVQIGAHTVVAAQTGISGSSVLGHHVVVGGQVGIADHCTLEDGAVAGAQAGIPTGKTIRGGQTGWGTA